jgi:type II secretory pathway pseudopilin PulG
VSPAPRRRVTGLTLIETALLLSIGGVVLAVAVPTVARTIETSKVSEASAQLQRIYTGVASYYAKPRQLAERRSHCLPDAAGPTPLKPSALPVPVDFGQSPSWAAIGFAPSQPLRYRYTYSPTGTACTADAPYPHVALRAEGDLDGDGSYSTFERTAQGDAHGLLRPGTTLRIHDRVE